MAMGSNQRQPDAIIIGGGHNRLVCAFYLARAGMKVEIHEARGVIGGDIFHGRMSLDQHWAARPVLGHADYRGPLTGLYMCGSGTHPGGGVTGAPGHNAARAVLADRRWWR